MEVKKEGEEKKFDARKIAGEVFGVGGLIGVVIGIGLTLGILRLLKKI
jgi:hypothetical protein